MMKQPGQQFGSGREFLRANRVLFFSLIAGVVIFILIVTGLHLTDLFGPVPIEAPLAGNKNVLLAVAGITVLLIGVAWVIYNKGVTHAKSLTGSVNDKLHYYRSSFLRYMALCDGAAVISGIALYLTGNFQMLIITAVALAAMLAKAPSRKRVIDELGLDWKEQEEL